MRAPALLRGLLLAGLATAQLSVAPRVVRAAAPGPELTADRIAPSLPSNQALPGIEPGWLGLSGKLRAIFVLPPEGYDQSGAVAAEPALPEVSHRVYVVTPLAATQDSLWAIPLIPFAAKEGTVLQGYRIGTWPQERRRVRSSYVSPEGFIEVTPENQLTRVSENFRLIDFLTHDQDDVWPKYLVLRPQLVDKLELISNELARRGRPSTIKILSGFRSPQYNAQGVGRKGGRVCRRRRRRSHGRSQRRRPRELPRLGVPARGCGVRAGPVPGGDRRRRVLPRDRVARAVRARGRPRVQGALVAQAHPEFERPGE